MAARRELIHSALMLRQCVIESKGRIGGSCISMSLTLVAIFNNLGVRCWLSSGIAQLGEDEIALHAWVTFPDGNVLDATLDQFEEGRKLDLQGGIYFGRLPKFIKAYR